VTAAKKLLLVSHNPLLTTGYGRVTAVLASWLASAGHDVVVLALGYDGEPFAGPYRMLRWSKTEAIGEIAASIQGERPDLLMTIGDPWMYERVPALPERRHVRWLAYFPVDGYPLPAAWKTWVAAVDVPVVFCEFSRRVVAEATGISPHVIPHGVDIATFAPRDKAVARARVGVDGKFVVGTVAANQQRKNLPALLRAFAEFARDKDDALLYLHTRVAGGYWEIDELADRFGIEPKTRATLNLDPHRGVGDEVLATIYNAMDVFVLPTMAEGFGLPIIESQACGVPALVTDFSACSELVPDDLCRLQVKGTLIMARNFEQAIVDERDIVEKLERLYGNRGQLAELSQRCLEFARGFEWRTACAKMAALVKVNCRRWGPS
jgi:glycosyltransferase involved in cell wall biosynthesis